MSADNPSQNEDGIKWSRAKLSGVGGGGNHSGS